MKERRAHIELLAESLLVAALCYFFFFYGLSAFGLVGADEPRYAQVAREMLMRRDWLTPTLYGNVWLEKPALYYWGAVVSYKLFGVSDWAARFPGAVFASGLVAFIFLWTRRFRSGSQLDAVVATASTVFVFAFARAASVDIELVVPLTIGLLAWWSFYETQEKKWLALFYASTALGMLAKGPVAPALAAMVLLVFLGVRQEWSMLRRSLWLPGILLFIVIALPWYVAVQHANPGFFREFFLQHNLDRFATNRYQHRQHFWYYIPVLLAGTLPWTVFLVAGLTRGMRGLRRDVDDALLSFLAIWIVVPFVFFSLSQSKLPGYILPSIAPAGLAVAMYLRSQAVHKASPALVAIHALLCGVLLGAVFIAPYKLYRLPLPATVLKIAIPMALLAALSVAMVVLLRGYAALRIATLVPIVLAVAFLLKAAGPAVDSSQSMRPVAQRVSVRGSVPVLFYKVPRGVEYGLAFYLDRPLPEAPPDEIVKFGTAASGNQSPEKTLKDVSQRVPPMRGDAVLVARSGTIDSFAAELSPEFHVEPWFRVSAQKLDVYYIRDSRQEP